MIYSLFIILTYRQNNKLNIKRLEYCCYTLQLLQNTKYVLIIYDNRLSPESCFEFQE